MRFRCKIVDVSCLNHFTRVVNTITKLTKSCTLRLAASNLYFILTDKVANGGVSMWCELCQANFFDEYQMEGVSAEQNEIFLELIPENLSRALKTAQNAKTVKIKLTNKHCPCITVSVELVSIYLPAIKTMKSVVERMKNLSNFIVIEANRNGEINLKIETDLVSVSTHFKDLGNPPWVSDESSQSNTQERDRDIMSEARVDIRKFLQFLAGQQVNPNKAICKKKSIHGKLECSRGLFDHYSREGDYKESEVAVEPMEERQRQSHESSLNPSHNLFCLI
ncbi:checkpoint protein HUS1 isoform X3 [Dendrobates tinctorius]|uniref:checkpoint protein HUS1 isoform X3 n=1 Tax=Dendrobates tinctorius TaxID=92724 RepID=UPI003CC9BE86